MYKIKKVNRFIVVYMFLMINNVHDLIYSHIIALSLAFPPYIYMDKQSVLNFGNI